jgi:flagellar motor protein MotB
MISRILIWLILLSFIFNATILLADKATPQPTQTREEIYILIKDELNLTVNIYQTQVEILAMMVTLQQRNLDRQNAEFSNQIEELKRLKLYEGELSIEQIALLQEQLNSTKDDLSIANLNLEQLAVKVEQTETKIQEYYDIINKLAFQFITEVESNKKPNLSPAILKTMKDNYVIMLQASIATGMNKNAFDNFQRAVDEYIKFVASYGGNTDTLVFNHQQILQYFTSAELTQNQYLEMKMYMHNLKKMLEAEVSEKNELQRRLDELKNMPGGKTYEDKIYFSSGSVELNKEAIKILQEFAASVPDDDHYEIMITGFSDTTPIGAKLREKYASNWELSLARASAVVVYMLDTLKFPPEKIIIAGKGQYSTNQNPDAKELSRKVEFRFVPKSN